VVVVVAAVVVVVVVVAAVVVVAPCAVHAVRNTARTRMERMDRIRARIYPPRASRGVDPDPIAGFPWATARSAVSSEA